MTKNQKKYVNRELASNKVEEIKRLKSDLKKIRNKFDEAESIAHFGVCELDPVTFDPIWTDGLFKIMGLDPRYGQPKVDDLRKIIQPEDWNVFYKAIHTVSKVGKDVEFDLRIIRADNSFRILHVIAKPKKDENGKIVTVRSTCQDITDLKRMEKKLADSERRYRYLVEKATAGMFILDKNGIIKFLNEYMAQMLDYTKNEMLERHIKSFIDESKYFYRFRNPLENKIERYDRFKFLNKEGNVFWSILTISPVFNSKKEFIGLLGVVTDFNMHKGLEEAFLGREEIFTDIIYDMMEMLSITIRDKDNFGFNKSSQKN